MSLRIRDFNYSVDLAKALLWQHTDAANLQKLIAQKNEWYEANNSQFWANWVRDVFDLRTANEFGLSVWAKILNVPLTFTADAAPAGRVAWGFGPQRRNFNNGNFKRAVAGTVLLSTEQKRLVLRLRYFQLVTDGSVLGVNKFLNSLFLNDYGLVYARDNMDMTITYVFTVLPPSQLRTVLDKFDVLPRPTGVAANFETP